MPDDHYIDYLHEDTNTLARWWGGEYIDIGYIDSDGEFVAWDCLNVWDHAKNEAEIPFTWEALKAEVDEHIA